MGDLVTDELITLQTVASITGTLSALGSGYIIVNALSTGWKNLESADRFVSVLSFMDFFASIAFAFGRFGILIEFFCPYQAFMIQFFSLGTVLWNGW